MSLHEVLVFSLLSISSHVLLKNEFEIKKHQKKGYYDKQRNEKTIFVTRYTRTKWDELESVWTENWKKISKYRSFLLLPSKRSNLCEEAGLTQCIFLSDFLRSSITNITFKYTWGKKKWEWETNKQTNQPLIL